MQWWFVQGTLLSLDDRHGWVTLAYPKIPRIVIYAGKRRRMRSMMDDVDTRLGLSTSKVLKTRQNLGKMLVD